MQLIVENPNSPLLCGYVESDDKITERKVSIKNVIGLGIG